MRTTRKGKTVKKTMNNADIKIHFEPFAKLYPRQILISSPFYSMGSMVRLRTLLDIPPDLIPYFEPFLQPIDEDTDNEDAQPLFFTLVMHETSANSFIDKAAYDLISDGDKKFLEEDLYEKFLSRFTAKIPPLENDELLIFRRLPIFAVNDIQEEGKKILSWHTRATKLKLSSPLLPTDNIVTDFSEERPRLTDINSWFLKGPGESES